MSGKGTGSARKPGSTYVAPASTTPGSTRCVTRRSPGLVQSGVALEKIRRGPRPRLDADHTISPLEARAPDGEPHGGEHAPVAQLDRASAFKALDSPIAIWRNTAKLRWGFCVFGIQGSASNARKTVNGVGESGFSVGTRRGRSSVQFRLFAKSRVQQYVLTLTPRLRQKAENGPRRPEEKWGIAVNK